jgi:hypothetical protein
MRGIPKQLEIGIQLVSYDASSRRRGMNDPSSIRQTDENADVCIPFAGREDQGPVARPISHSQKRFLIGAVPRNYFSVHQPDQPLGQP